MNLTKKNKNKSVVYSVYNGVEQSESQAEAWLYYKKNRIVNHCKDNKRILYGKFSYTGTPIEPGPFF